MTGFQATIRETDQIGVKLHGKGLVMVQVAAKYCPGQSGYTPSDFIHMSEAKAMELYRALGEALPPDTRRIGLPDDRTIHFVPDPAASETETLKSLRWLIKQIETGKLAENLSTEDDKRQFVQGLAEADQAIKDAEGRA